MAGIITKGQIGYEDLNVGTGTFSRATSTGGSQTIHQIPLPSQSVTLVDISTAQTLTNKTLTAPVITNPSTTGTDSGTETLVNKTLTAPVITSPSTTGTDSGTETLQNKTLNGASNGNSVTLLNQQGSSGAITGNGAQQNLYSYVLPASVLGPAKSLRVTCYANHASGSASVTYSITFGALGLNFIATANTPVKLVSEILNLTANSQIMFNTGMATTVTNTGLATGNVNTASSVTISVTFTVANTDTVAPSGFMVELIQ